MSSAHNPPENTGTRRHRTNYAPSTIIRAEESRNLSQRNETAAYPSSKQNLMSSSSRNNSNTNFRFVQSSNNTDFGNNVSSEGNSAIQLKTLTRIQPSDSKVRPEVSPSTSTTSNRTLDCSGSSSKSDSDEICGLSDVYYARFPKIIGKGFEPSYIDQAIQESLQSNPVRIKLQSYLFTFRDIEGKLKPLCFLDQPILFLESVDKCLRLCNKLFIAAEKIFECSIADYMEGKLESKIWNLLHAIFCTARQGLRIVERRREFEYVLNRLVPCAITYYENTLVLLSKKFGLNLDQVEKRYGTLQLETDEVKMTVLPTYVYRIYVYIGDLHRYLLDIEKQYRKIRIRRSMGNYESARLCIPSVGRAYYQMGVLSKTMDEYMAAAYYFTAAYMAEESTPGSRDQLLGIYDDLHKCYVKVRKSFWCRKSKALETFQRFGYIRQDIWIFPSASNVKPPRFPPEPEHLIQHLEKLSDVEIMRRFDLVFLLAVGKLFTRVGMEDFFQVAEEAVVYFQEYLVRRGQISLAKSLQIAGLLIFTVEHFIRSLKLKSAKPHSYETYLQGLAVDFLLEIFSLIVDRLISLIKFRCWEDRQLEPIGGAVNIICEWLSCNMATWVKPRMRPVYSVRRIMGKQEVNYKDRKDDVWEAFAKLMSQVEIVIIRFGQTVFPKCSIKEDDAYCCKIAPLPEHVYFVGVLDQSTLDRQIYCTDNFISSCLRGQTFIRLLTIHNFGKAVLTSSKVKYLKEVPAERYQVSEYKSIVKVKRPTKSNENCGLTKDNMHYHTATMRNNVKLVCYELMSLPPKVRYPKPLPPDCNNRRIVLKDFPREKKILPGQPLRPRMRTYEVWVRMGDNGFRTDYVINPERVIIDTNCYIDHLDLIRVLVWILPDRIWLPVSVIGELKGLSRGGFTKKDKIRFKDNLRSTEALKKLQRNEIIAQHAADAINFINEHLKYFKIVSTHLDEIKVNNINRQIKENFYNPSMSNDDRILDTCKNVECRDKKLRSLDTPHRVFRNTVLLTSDRCLRIRTITSMDLPVREIHSFTYWAVKSLNYVRKPKKKRAPGKRKYPLGYWNYVARAEH